MSGNATTILRPHKNSSQRRTFEMPGGETEYVRRSTTHETYRSQTPIAKKLLDDKGIDSIVAEKGCHGIKSKIGGWENTGFEKKRKELEEHLWKTITEQVMNDLAIKAKNHYNQYSQFKTTYGSTFQIKGFTPKEIGETLNEELCAKYPLYNTNGMSVPVNRYECYKAKQSIHKSLAHLFKRDSRFTSRMSNPNDYHAPVDPGHFAFV